MKILTNQHERDLEYAIGYAQYCRQVIERERGATGEAGALRFAMTELCKAVERAGRALNDTKAVNGIEEPWTFHIPVDIEFSHDDLRILSDGSDVTEFFLKHAPIDQWNEMVDALEADLQEDERERQRERN